MAEFNMVEAKTEEKREAKKITVYSFVAKKISILDEENSWSKAMLAKLRRAIGKQPGATPEIWAITLTDAPESWRGAYNKIASGNVDKSYDWLDGCIKPSYAEYAVHVALTLYALHRQGSDKSVNLSGKSKDGKYLGNSIGGAAAMLVKPDGSNLNAVKNRFDKMATAVDFNELAYHARGIVQMLESKNKMDYPRFASDLFAYQIPGRADEIRLRWGEDFYRVLYSNSKNGEEGELL